MPTPIKDQPLAQLRAACVIGADDTLASIATRHFAFAKLKAFHGQRVNHAALAHLPKHTILRAEVPRPAARDLHLISDRTNLRPQVAAILAARMLAGLHVEGGAA